MSRLSGYIDTLTPLRGIAALWVVVFHYNEFLFFMKLGPLVDRADSMLLRHGYLWVDFFFILSGFIITHVYAEKLRAGGMGAAGQYLWARFTRLYPLHLFCMLLLLVFSIGLKAVYPAYYAQEWEAFFPFKDFFVYLGFGVSFGWIQHYSWNLPAWSIAAEWWAYVAAVLLIPLLHTGFKSRTVLAWVAASVGLAALVAWGGHEGLDYTLNFGVVRCVLEFSIGIGVYQLYRRLLHVRSVAGADWAFGLAIVATLALLHSDWHDVLVLPLFCLVIVCAALNSGRFGRLLNSRPLRFLGDISYSVYLLQLFWILIWSAWLDLHLRIAHPVALPGSGEKLLWLALILAAVIASAALTYRFIEIPGREFLRKLSGKKPHPTVAVLASSP